MKTLSMNLAAALPLLLAACTADNVISTDVADLEDAAVASAADEALVMQCGFGAETRAGTDVQTSLFPVGSTVYVWLNNFKVDTGSAITDMSSDTRYDCTVASDSATLMPALAAGTKLRYPGPGSYPTAYGIKPLPAGTTFTVQTNQKTDANYLASDLVYSEKRTYQQSTGILKMQFNHLFSKIVVVLQGDGDGVTADDLADAEVTVAARPRCTFDYPTQTYVSPSDIDQTQDVVNVQMDLENPTEATAVPTAYGACIIPPQGITQNTPFIYVSVSGHQRDPIRIPAGGKTFEGGKEYRYTLVVKDDVWEVELADVTVDNWTAQTGPTMVVDGKVWN